MVEDRHVQAWLAEGLITAAQAQRMRADVAKDRAARASDRLVVVMSTIGAILLGIGAILFIASNWQALSRLAKVVLLAGSTFGVSYLGYVLAYERAQLPKVGAALLFLGSLLFGATIFLIGQIYHVQAHSHALVLVWLIGILPLAYALASVPVTGLAALLTFLWIGLWIFRGLTLREGDWLGLPVLYLLAGALLFELGGWHYLSSRLVPVARTWRIASLKVIVASLFLLTFRFFTGTYEHWTPSRLEISWQMRAGVGVLGAAAIAAGLAGLSANPTKSTTWRLEGGLGLGLCGLALASFFLPMPGTNVYPVLFNLAMAVCIAALIGVGYQREDLRLVNIGMSSLSLLVVVRYCDFFWGLLSRSVFFLIGGLILVLGGMALERKRRELKARFGA